VDNDLDLGAVGDLLVDPGFLQTWDLDDFAAICAALEQAIGLWSGA
jgi:hypothetical protein